MNCGVLDKAAKILALVGALNWGLVSGVGGLDFNLVTTLLGSWPAVVEIVYLLIGLSGLYLLVGLVSKKGCCAS